MELFQCKKDWAKQTGEREKYPKLFLRDIYTAQLLQEAEILKNIIIVSRPNHSHTHMVFTSGHRCQRVLLRVLLGWVDKTVDWHSRDMGLNLGWDNTLNNFERWYFKVLKRPGKALSLSLEKDYLSLVCWTSLNLEIYHLLKDSF